MEEDLRILETLINGIEAPYVKVRSITLGGTTSFAVSVSLQKKGEWLNGIFENSSYAKFMVTTNDMKVEMISKDFTVKTFRKTKWKTFEDAAKKIDNWVKAQTKET